MQNNHDNIPKDSLLSYLAYKKQLSIFINTLKINITPSNEFFFIYAPLIGIKVLETNDFNEFNKFFLIIDYCRSDSVLSFTTGCDNNSEWLYGNRQFIIEDYTFIFREGNTPTNNDFENKMVIEIFKTDATNITDDDLEYLLSLIEVIGFNINNRKRIYRNKLDNI